MVKLTVNKVIPNLKINNLSISYDSMFFNFWVNKIINRFMFSGKQFLSEKLVYKTLYILNRFSVSLYMVFECLDYIKPAVEILSKRMGRAFYQIPSPLNYKRQIQKAICWLFKAVFNLNYKNKKPVFFFFISELKAIIYYNRSVSIAECTRVHNQGVYGRTYTYWRWK